MERGCFYPRHQIRVEMMAGFRNVAELATSMNAGQQMSCSIRKVPSQATTAGWWADLSMASGNPPPNYYASNPLEAATLDGMRGIFHGDDKTPSTKHLMEWALCTPTAGLVGRYKLMDYLLYYPFVDLDDGDAQVMDNATTLPRYATGDGVRAMLVAAAPTAGSGQFTFDYVNQDGESKTSPTQFCSVASSPIASIITSEQGTAAGGELFLKLADGDTGIRSITTFTNSVLNGGLGAIVLVKPLAGLAVYEASVPSEKSWTRQAAGAPRIYDGAYLGMVMNCAATIAAGTLAGRMTFAWN